MHRISVTGYEITIAPGALAALGEIARRTAPARRYAVVSDGNVAALYAQQVLDSLGRDPAELFVVPAGEAEKNRERWATLTDLMLSGGFGRDATVIALGGGVIGDLAGFVAATYMRGIPVIQVPTTLLAMVDASVGGKTGVDTPAGKNLVGAFHRPAAVVIDPAVLATLPERPLAAGFAEVIKHGAIADAGYFEAVSALLPELLRSRDPDSLAQIVECSIRIKGAIVERDELDRGERAVLNFGHTIGHAIEALSGYEVPHGEAIAIGMVIESAIGERLGITEPGTSARIASALARAELPVRRPPGISPRAIIETTRVDKKRTGGVVRYPLPVRIGAMDSQWRVPVPDEVVAETLE